MKVFIDQTAWLQIVNPKATYHQIFQDELNKALVKGDRLFTHNVAVGLAFGEILKTLGSIIAGKFNEIIEDAYTGTHLNILWISRRTQKEAVRMLRKQPDLGLDVYDFAACILMRRRRIQTVITTKNGFNSLELKVIPGIGE
jgi:predicted nucleic acid-binding protein